MAKPKKTSKKKKTAKKKEPVKKEAASKKKPISNTWIVGIIAGIAVIVIVAFLLAPMPAYTNGVHICTPAQKAAEICTLEYAPVCGDGITYGNACQACASKRVDTYTIGECVAPEGAHICTPEEKQAEVCTMEYDPVCGSDGETYSNGCQACSAGLDYYVEGEC